jgi:hypothetical protein
MPPTLHCWRSRSGDPAENSATVFVETLTQNVVDAPEDDVDTFAVEQIALAARLDDIQLQNRRLVFDVHALTRTRAAIEASVRELSIQEALASKEAETLAAQAREVLMAVEAQTKEKAAVVILIPATEIPCSKMPHES